MSFYIFHRHRVCLVDHVDLIHSLYSWWEGFESSTLATLPLGFSCGFISTHACGSSSGGCSWGCPGGLVSASVRLRCGGGESASIAGVLAAPGTQGSWQLGQQEIQCSRMVWLSLLASTLQYSCLANPPLWERSLVGHSSVQFSRSVVSNFLWPRELQHIRPPCPSPAPTVCKNSCPLSWWWHLTISSSVIHFSFCPQSLPASRSFPMSQLFAWGGQSIGVSASASLLPMNTQDWSPLGWTGWISLQSKGLSRVFSNTTVQKHQLFCAWVSLKSNPHIRTWLLDKP